MSTRMMEHGLHRSPDVERAAERLARPRARAALLAKRLLDTVLALVLLVAVLPVLVLVLLMLGFAGEGMIERRTRLKPKRPFLPLNKNETRGPGAWEAVARVSQLRIGDEIFTGGFADPNAWSDSATTTELGLNWYLNQAIRATFDYYHTHFENNVAAPSALLLQQDEQAFISRLQLAF